MCKLVGNTKLKGKKKKANMQNNNYFIACILSEDNITPKGAVCLLKWAKNKTKQNNIPFSCIKHR